MNVEIGDELVDDEGTVWIVDSTINNPPNYAYLKERNGCGHWTVRFNEIGEGLKVWPSPNGLITSAATGADK